MSKNPDALAAMPRGEDGATALTTLLGHKGDLMIIHFRQSFDELNVRVITPYRKPNRLSGGGPDRHEEKR